jgi:hypothetical protein
VTRLILHAGTEFVGAGMVREDLIGHRQTLRAAGVLIPHRDDAPAWRELASGVLRRTPTSMALLNQARETGAEALLLSSDLLSDALVSPDAAAGLATLAAEEDLEVRIVAIVREQVGYINQLYCHRVMSMETSRNLAQFAAQAVPAHRFDYVASFGAVADTEGLELAAVSYPDLLTLGAGRAVMEAAGLDPAVAEEVGSSKSEPPPLPGPVLIEAARLLHKRFRWLNAFVEEGKPRLRELTAQLAAVAVEAGWDSTEYWGWTSQHRLAVEEEYAESNAVFAEFVWGTRWPEPWSDGKRERIDLADLSPALLREVLTTVEELADQAILRPTDPSDA